MDYNCVIAALLVLGLVVVSPSEAAESQESDSLHFFYDPNSHYFVLRTRSTCFFTLLTRVESDHVHTTHGKDDLEIQFMREWLGLFPEVKIFHDDPALPRYVLRWCTGQDMFYINRNITVPTPKSPLGNLLVGR